MNHLKGFGYVTYRHVTGQIRNNELAACCKRWI